MGRWEGVTTEKGRTRRQKSWGMENFARRLVPCVFYSIGIVKSIEDEPL